jgi:hypothetical protein
MSLADDLAVSSECLTKVKEGLQGHEGEEGKEGTDVTPEASAAGGTSWGCIPLQEATKPAKEVPTLSDNNTLSDVDASQKTESALSDYQWTPLTALEERQELEHSKREALARDEQVAKWMEALHQTARPSFRVEVPLLQEDEVPLVDYA